MTGKGEALPPQPKALRLETSRWALPTEALHRNRPFPAEALRLFPKKPKRFVPVAQGEALQPFGLARREALRSSCPVRSASTIRTAPAGSASLKPIFPSRSAPLLDYWKIYLSGLKRFVLAALSLLALPKRFNLLAQPEALPLLHSSLNRSASYGITKSGPELSRRAQPKRSLPQPAPF